MSSPGNAMPQPTVVPPPAFPAMPNTWQTRAPGLEPINPAAAQLQAQHLALIQAQEESRVQQEHMRQQQQDAMNMRVLMEQQQASILQQQQEIEQQRVWFAAQVGHLSQQAAATSLPNSVGISNTTPGPPTLSSLPASLHPSGQNTSPARDIEEWTLSPSTAEARRANRLALDELWAVAFWRAGAAGLRAARRSGASAI